MEKEEGERMKRGGKREGINWELRDGGNKS